MMMSQVEQKQKTIYKLNNIKRTYMQGEVQVFALRGINLEIEEGEFTVFVGPSGSGKTTLFNLMGGLDFPTEGEILFDGQSLGALNEKKRSRLRLYRMGFVFQAYNLLPVLSARENIEYVLTLRGEDPSSRKARAMEMLDVVGLADYADRRPSQMSGGQQQRVAVARALVGKPEVILADEPTANLDSSTSDDLIQYMERINEQFGTTFLFSTHDPLVMERARKVITIRDGLIDPGDGGARA